MKFYVLKEIYSHEEKYDIGSDTSYEKIQALKRCMEERRVHDYPAYEIIETNTLTSKEIDYINNHPSEPLWVVNSSVGTYQIDFNFELNLVNSLDIVTLRNAKCFVTPDGMVIARAPDRETAIKYWKKLLEKIISAE